MKLVVTIVLACVVCLSPELILAEVGEPPVNGCGQLEKLDARTPLRLSPRMALHQKQNMREHLEAVQEITLGAAKGDFLAVASAASKIGYTEAMARMCQHMGAGAEGFTERAIVFHKTADKIVAAAHRGDMKGVLTDLAETLGHCANCHATYRQEIVDDGIGNP